MKRTLYIIIVNFVIIFIINLFNPLLSMATTNAIIYLQTDTDVIENGEEIEVSFCIKKQKTAAYTANIYFDNTKLDFVSGPENIKVDENQIKIVWYDSQGGSGAKQGELGRIVFKAKEEGLANFVINGEFFSEKGQLIQTNFENLELQIGKEETSLKKQAIQEQGNSIERSNTNLQTLRIDIEGLVPSFQTDVYEYDLTVSNEISNIEVLAISENPNAQVEITGNIRIK